MVIQEVVRMLLKDNRVEVNAKDDLGRTALIWASRNGCQEVVGRLLIDERVDVNAKDFRGHSAFFWANYSGSPDTIRVFLQHEGRMDVNATGRGALGNTPLMWACLRGRAAIVSEMLAAFPMLDVHAKNKAGSSALDIARELKLLEIARLLEARTESDFRRDR